jgi:hypothetical protein
METLGSILEIKTSNILSNEYYCDICDYKCCKRFNYDRHILTPKHIKNIDRKPKRAKNEQNEQKKKQIIKDFECEKCYKIYQTHAGLWKHKQKCNTIITDSNSETVDKDQLIIMLIKQNAELMKETTEFKHIMLEQQTMMMKVVENGTHNTSHTTNTNSHNKTFNLNVFLNETCKNALNINEFVSSIKVSLDDLENTGRQGYIEGISSIILNKLKNLNHYDRPIHCADQKREILYIKNDNQWIKESEEKPLLTKAIKTIANENIKQIKTWRDKNPECVDSDSKKNNLYLKIVSNSMSGTDKEECDKNINKIISNVAKEVIIDK